MEYEPFYHERLGMLVYRRGCESSEERLVSYCYLSRNMLRFVDLCLYHRYTSPARGVARFYVITV